MQVEHAQASLKKEMRQLESIREEMRQAHVKKKSLDLLEEKQRAAYLKQLELREEKEIEDLIISRQPRRS